jgi:predicted RNase H-like HicB family nuclease
MRQVTVVYHCEDGVWWADSPTPGLETFVAGGGSLDETRRLAREGAAFHLGDKVRVTELYDSQHVVTHFRVSQSALHMTVSGGSTPSGSTRPRVTLTPAQPCAMVS